MNITFIGLGKMGTAIVERLLHTGCKVRVYNRTAEKMRPLVTLGAQASSSLKEAVENANIVLSSLLDDEAVKTVTDDMLAYLPKNSVHIGLSTILPDTATAVAAQHLSHHTHYISAAVLGIPQVAKEGKLTTFLAGADKQIEAVWPVLNCFSENIFPMGEMAKNPLIMKICMNYSLITTIELISELFIFAEKSGLERQYIKKGLHAIYGHPAYKRYIDKIDEQSFDDVNFDMIGGNKDVALFQNAFAKVGVVPEIANIVRARFISALAKGQQNKDWSGIYDIVREQSGLES